MLLQNARNKDDTRGGLGINRGGCDNGALSLTVRRMCAEVAEMTDQQKADYKKECEERAARARGEDTGAEKRARRFGVGSN